MTAVRAFATKHRLSKSPPSCAFLTRDMRTDLPEIFANICPAADLVRARLALMS